MDRHQNQKPTIEITCLSHPTRLGQIATRFRPEDELRSGAVIVNPAFRDLIGGDDVEVRKHYTGTEWAEGPAYVPGREGSDGFVVFSDVPNNRMLRYDPIKRRNNDLPRT